MTTLEPDDKLSAKPEDNRRDYYIQADFDQDILAVGMPANLQLEIPLEFFKQLQGVEYLRIEINSSCLGYGTKGTLLKIADVKSSQQSITVVPSAAGYHDFRVEFVINNERIAGLNISREVTELSFHK